MSDERMSEFPALVGGYARGRGGELVNLPYDKTSFSAAMLL